MAKNQPGFPLWRYEVQRLFLERNDDWLKRVQKEELPDICRIIDQMDFNMVDYVKLAPIRVVAGGKVMPSLKDMSIQFLNLPYQELMELAHHSEANVRLALALRLGFEKRHEKPALRLANDDDVRYVLALNFLCPKVALSRLAGDSDVWVRRRVAYHGRLSRADANKLQHDEDETVRLFARHQLAEFVSLH